MIVGRVIKQPGELSPVTWDFTADLTVGETIADATVTATNARTGGSGSAILNGSPVTNPPLVTQKIQAGAARDIYVVQCRATTNANLIFEHEIEVHVVEE